MQKPGTILQTKLFSIKLSIKMHFIINLQCFNRDNNLAVVTPIYKNWIPLYFPSCEEFENPIVVSIF